MVDVSFRFGFVSDSHRLFIGWDVMLFTRHSRVSQLITARSLPRSLPKSHSHLLSIVGDDLAPSSPTDASCSTSCVSDPGLGGVNSRSNAISRKPGNTGQIT